MVLTCFVLMVYVSSAFCLIYLCFSLWPGRLSLLSAEVQTLRVGDSRPRLEPEPGLPLSLSPIITRTQTLSSSAGPSYSREAWPVLLLRSPHNRLEKGWGTSEGLDLSPLVSSRARNVSAKLIYGFNKHFMPSEKILTLLFIVSFLFSNVNVL